MRNSLIRRPPPQLTGDFMRTTAHSYIGLPFEFSPACGLCTQSAVYEVSDQNLPENFHDSAGIKLGKEYLQIY